MARLLLLSFVVFVGVSCRSRTETTHRRQAPVERDHVLFSRLASSDDAGRGAELRKPTGHTEQVTCLVADPKGTWIASGSSDTTVRLWDARSGAAVQALLGHERRITALAVTPDGKRLVSGSLDRRVTVWTLPSGEAQRTWHAHGYGPCALMITGDGQRLVSGGLDEPLRGTSSVKTWDLSTGEMIQRIDDFSGSVNHVFVDPTGQHFVTESSLRARALPMSELGAAKQWLCRIRVWDAKTGGTVRTIAESERQVLAGALSPAGTTLATGGTDGAVTLWDIGTGEADRRLRGAEGLVTAVVFSGDGSWVLGCGTDRRFLRSYLKVWEARSGAQLGSVEVEVVPTCMLVHECVVWLGAADGTIRRYRMQWHR